MLISEAAARAVDAIADRRADVLSDFEPQVFAPIGSAPGTMAPEGTYFAVRSGEGVRYTRNAALSVNGGMLTDGDGAAVLGYPEPGEPLQPLRVDAVDAALGMTSGVRLQADGSVVYDRDAIDPQTGALRAQTVVVGRIALARFPAGTRLQSVHGGRVIAPSHVVAHFGVPDSDGFAALRPFAPSIDADLERSLERLNDAYLTLDALRAATISQSSVQKTAMDLLK